LATPVTASGVCARGTNTAMSGASFGSISRMSFTMPTIWHGPSTRPDPAASMTICSPSGSRPANARRASSRLMMVTFAEEPAPSSVKSRALQRHAQNAEEIGADSEVFRMYFDALLTAEDLGGKIGDWFERDAQDSPLGRLAVVINCIRDQSKAIAWGCRSGGDCPTFRSIG
jgi:hypothetical protein